MWARYFLAIREIHVGCVALSGALFVVRGVLRLRANPLANHRLLRIASVAIDTVLLSAALLLALILWEFPFKDAWLTAKLALLMIYIVLGSVALKGNRSGRDRAAAFVAALLVYTAIIAVAVNHVHPWRGRI